MQKFVVALLLVFFSLLSFHCQKEVSYSRGNSNNNNDPSPVMATVQGNIVDETGQPAAGVMIKAGSKTAITDADGYFRIVNAALDKKSSLVTAEKSGYFKAYRSFMATTGANHINIKLIEKKLAGTISNTGGEVVLASGAKVLLPSNAVVKQTGGSYNGTINVYAAFINPTASDIGQLVPGSFMANDAANKRVILTSYGMMAVELESTTGEKLQIATGSAATLTMPIASSIQSTAPASISLWYVDEQNGIWKEEGTATKTGTQYVGQVKHFSFWNCDVSSQTINLSMTLKNNEGSPLVHVPVRIKRTAAGFASQGYGYTDSLGQVNGLVPASESLLLEVLDPCNNAVYTQNIGPYSQNTSLGTVTVNNIGNSLVTITGRIVNCSGTPVTNGYAIIGYDNRSSYVNVNNNGQFSLSFTRCTASPAACDITGVDNATQQQGTITNISVVSPVTNAGTITACGVSAAQYINYTLNGTNYSLSSATQADSLMGYTNQQGASPFTTWIMGSNWSTSSYISFDFTSPATAGVYPVNTLSVNTFQRPFLIQPFNVTISNFPQATGQFYEGSFSGQFRDSLPTAPVQTISGTFRLRK